MTHRPTTARARPLTLSLSEPYQHPGIPPQSKSAAGPSREEGSRTMTPGNGSPTGGGRALPLAAALLLGLAAAVAAPAPPAAAETLVETVAAAVATNPEVAAVREGRRAVEQELRGARAGY